MQRNLILSISLITYNQKKYISQTIESVLQQQVNFKYEIIIGDDCSTDGTREILLSYQERYPDLINLILHPVRNTGIPGKVNFISTINAAKGKYVALLDGDDFWTDPLKLQKQIDFLEANPSFALCFHNAKIEFTRNSIFEEWIMHKELEKSVFETKDLLKQWFIPTASILFRNYDDFVLPEWFNHVDSGDIAVLLLLSMKGKFKYLDEVMCVYRLHDKGFSLATVGYRKAISMTFLYQNFNILTDFIYNKEITDAIVYEYNNHLPEIQELKQLKARSLPRRIKQKIKRIFRIKP